MAADAYVRTITLLVPGPWATAEPLVEALAADGITARAREPERDLAPGEVEIEIVEDAALAGVFGDRHGAANAAERSARAGAFHAAALVDVAIELERPGSAMRLAALGRALRRHGGTAVRMELSGATHDWDTWTRHLDAGVAPALLALALRFVSDGRTVFTCGMHHFGAPDAEIAMDDTSAAASWLQSFQLFVLHESPVLASGHTFRPSERFARRVLERWPDARHAPGDGRRNPYGVWRFLPEGEPGLPPSEPVPTILPSLVAVLMARESTLGRPLRRDEVESITDACPAVELSQREAQMMERARGYADIEPRLAWEQWQIVRAR